jgi:hypothetical protein
MKRFITKISLALISLLIGLSPLLNSAPVSASGIYEYRGVAPAGDGNLYDEGAFNQDLAQSFVAVGNHTVTSVSVYMKREGVDSGVGSISADITPINGTDFTPLGAPIVSSTGSLSGSSVSNTTGAWYSITMDSSEIVDGTTYALVLTPSGIDTAKCIGWYFGNADGAGLSGHSASSTNGGVWVPDAVNYYSFRIYGEDYTPPTAPTVVTEAATAITGVGATLHGNLTSMGDADSARVEFFYGLTTDYGYYKVANFSQTEIGEFSVVDTAMTSNTTYHYKAVATGRDSEGNDVSWASGTDMTFTTIALTVTPSPTPTSVAPSVTTDLFSHVSSSSVNLFGSLTALGTANNCTVGFKIGEDNPPTQYSFAAYESPMSSPGEFYLTVEGLTVGTTYYFRAFAVGDGEALGNILSFNQTETVISPVVVTDNPTAVNALGAILNGNLTVVGLPLPANCSFQMRRVGQSNWVTFSTSTLNVMNTTGTYNITVAGASPDTWYEYRAIATNAYVTVYGDIFQFFTGSIPTPLDYSATLNPASSITSTSATVSVHIFGGNVTNMTSVSAFFSYGIYSEGNAALISSTEQSILGEGTIIQSLTNLQPGTQYKYAANTIVGGTGKTTNWMYFTTLTSGGTTPGVTPTPTPTPTPTSLIPGLDIPGFDTSTPSGQWLTIILLMVLIPIILVTTLRNFPMVAVGLSVVCDALVLGWAIINWLDPWMIGLLAIIAGGIIWALIKSLFSGRGGG